jgi:hypothetical protein
MALEWSSLLWVLRSCALTLRMFFITLGSQLWLSTFCHQSQNIYRFRVLYFSPSLELKNAFPREFFCRFSGGSLLAQICSALGARRTAHDFFAFGFIASRSKDFFVKSILSCFFVCNFCFLFFSLDYDYEKLFGENRPIARFSESRGTMLRSLGGGIATCIMFFPIQKNAS